MRNDTLHDALDDETVFVSVIQIHNVVLEARFRHRLFEVVQGALENVVIAEEGLDSRATREIRELTRNVLVSSC